MRQGKVKAARVIATVALALAAALASVPGRAADLVLAEPVHYVGFLPVYVALDQGYFKDEGINLKISTMDGGAMVPAVVSGQAFALTASVDRNAMAKVSGKVIKAVVNLDARANIYLVARHGLAPANGDIAGFLKGKRIAVTAYGGTPNSMLRYLLAKWHLTPGKDVTLVEVNGQAVVFATIAAGQADVAVTAEPFISQGVAKGVWNEPFYAAKDLGPYADTALSVSGDSIKKEPKLVLSFVRAMMRGLVYTNDHRGDMLAVAKKEMPLASEADLKASLDRTFADGIYSTDGFIPPQAWTLGNAVVKEGGVLKEDVPYRDVVDMQFVKEAQKNLTPK